jgi:hypothetical protein
MWYWVTACMALYLDPTEVILENQKKLEARYGEKFTVNQSEVRTIGFLKILYRNKKYSLHS